MNRIIRRYRSPLITMIVIYLTFIGGTFITDFRFQPRMAHHVIMTGLLSGWVLALLLKKRAFPSTPLDWPIIAALTAATLSTIFALDPRVSIEYLWQVGVFALTFFVLVGLMRSSRPRLLLQAIFFTSAIVILMGLFEFGSWYFGWGWLPMFQYGWWQIGGLSNPIPPMIYRLTVTLIVSTWLSGYIAVLIPVAAAWGFASRKKDTRQMIALWLIGALIIEALAFSRGGLVSLGASLPTLALLALLGSRGAMHRVRGWLGDWRIIVGGIGAAVLLAGLVFMLVGRDSAGHISGDQTRLELWRNAWQMGLSDPLTGVGAGGFGRSLRFFRETITARRIDDFISPHSIPLHVWAETGLPGVAAMLSIVGMTGWIGYRRWRDAEGADRLRVAGVCAALVGYSVHNLFDTLTVTLNVLPVLVLVAYLVVPYTEAKRRFTLSSPRIVPAIILLMIGISAVGWWASDRAQYHFDQALVAYQTGEMESALDSIERAEELDPMMDFYTAQRAGFLGEMAMDNSEFMPDALAAYKEAISDGGRYDVLHTNIALLLYADGQQAEALSEMEIAAEIFPIEDRYHLWIGMMSEESGDSARAEEAYLVALNISPLLIGSAFWEETDLRTGVRESFIAERGVGGIAIDKLDDIGVSCWTYTTEDVSLICSGRINLYLLNDPERAIAAFDQAISDNPAERRTYIHRATAYLQLGDLDSAQRDADISQFFGERRTGLILGQLAEERGDTDAAISAYQSYAPLIVQGQGWGVSTYGRLGQIYKLSSAELQEAQYFDFGAWLALADLYTQIGEADQASELYDLILLFDPYFALDETP